MRHIECCSALWVIPVLLTVTMLCPLAHGTVIYVDAAAMGENTGSSWQNAFNSLQDALILARIAVKPVEIQVAQGTYRPDGGSGLTLNDPSASFALINGVAIRGGYAGLGNLDPNARDIAAFETILSGNLELLGRSTTRSLHVVTGSGVDASAVLDGCTVAGGNAYGTSEDGKGAGMLVIDGSPTILDCTFAENQGRMGAGAYIVGDSHPALNNCTFSDNYGSSYGGAVYIGSSPVFTDCTFEDNWGGSGGAIYCTIHSEPALVGCRFRANLAATGGAVYNHDSKASLTECIFESNSASGSGGAVLNSGGKPSFLRCLFESNSTEQAGGAAYNYEVTEATFRNCLFAGNSAGSGGAVANRYDGHTTLANCTFVGNTAHAGGAGLSNESGARASVTCCILWGNQPDEIDGDEMTFAFCDIRGGAPGEGIIDADPLFADPSGDYHLQSQAGRWNPETLRWIVDPVTSPCIDAGPPTDANGIDEIQPNGRRTNMGIYGDTIEASLSWPQPSAEWARKASAARPPSGDQPATPPVTLSWTPGQDAIAHDVYLGNTYEEVAGSSRDNPATLVSLGQTATTFGPVPPAWPACYWRIDEIDGQGNITEGDVWVLLGAQMKGRSCFTSETPVWVDGVIVPISQACVAQITDNAFGPTDVATSLAGANRIEQVQEHTGTFAGYDIVLETGNSIGVASCHYFMNDLGLWIAVQEIRAGTRLRTAAGSVTVVAVRRWTRPYVGKVYNLKIKNSDRYLVGIDGVIARDY